jgi:hypothetical protein
MSGGVTRHKVTLSDDIPEDNRLATVYAAAALISKTFHFLKKFLRIPLAWGISKICQSFCQILLELSLDDLNVKLTVLCGSFCNII